MPVTIVVGGQYGSEGKGKVAHFLADKEHAAFVVRCGGPNSGHTVIDKNGRARIFQQLPTAAILPDTKLAICAGSYIDLDILFREIRETGIDETRLSIDPAAVIITPELKAREAESGLIGSISSTGSGTGAGVAARVNREKSLLLAEQVKQLQPFIVPVPAMLRSALDQERRIIIEGTQGFGLSPFHAGHYPYVTSRDTTAAAFLSETGLSPLDVDDVVMVIRAFPIRVAGNSGPLPKETTWEEITRNGNHPTLIQEKTSVSKKIRRVAEFDPEIVRKAIEINKPTRIVLNHLDYYMGTRTDSEQNDKITEYILTVEQNINAGIDFVGFGPESGQMVKNRWTPVRLEVVHG